MRRERTLKRIHGAALLGVLVAAAPPVHADTVTLNFQTVFSGTAPAGVAPWLTATFTDVAPGTVQLAINASGLTGSESVDSLYFNLDPLLGAASLVFTRDPASTGPVAGNTSISLGADAYRADGDGFYDILIGLPPPPGSQAARFTAGESLIYSITGISTLSAASFLFLSQPGPGHGPGPQFAAAHIQQIGAAGDSGWTGATFAPVPLPAAAWLLASGLALAWRVGRRRESEFPVLSAAG